MNIFNKLNHLLEQALEKSFQRHRVWATELHSGIQTDSDLNSDGCCIHVIYLNSNLFTGWFAASKCWVCVRQKNHCNTLYRSAKCLCFGLAHKILNNKEVRNVAANLVWSKCCAPVNVNLYTFSETLFRFKIQKPKSVNKNIYISVFGIKTTARSPRPRIQKKKNMFCDGRSKLKAKGIQIVFLVSFWSKQKHFDNSFIGCACTQLKLNTEHWTLNIQHRCTLGPFDAVFIFNNSNVKFKLYG